MSPTKRFPFLALPIAVLIVSGCVSAAPPVPDTLPVTPTSTTLPTASPGSSPTTQTQLPVKIDEFMTGLVEHDRFSGALLVAQGGKVLLSKGYGMANRELGMPNTPQTKFRVGSITKQFTALAILHLEQQGKLNVQDPICRYIPDCPKAWQPITIHHLLTHTSGIPNFTEFAGYQEFKKQLTSPVEIINLFRDQPLDFVPGEGWNYSNSGYIVLGYIIERVSGRSYAVFLQHNIFEPLRMVDTGYDDNRATITQRAIGYATATINADYIDMSVPYAAGGLYSTVQDLFLWDRALYPNSLIPISLQNEMFTPFVTIPVIGREGLSNAGASYAYGWRIGKKFNRLWIAHGGGIDGFSAKLDRYPDDNVTIILLSNLENAMVGDYAVDIARMIFEVN